LLHQNIFQCNCLTILHTNGVGYPKKYLRLCFKPDIKNVLFNFFKIEVLTIDIKAAIAYAHHFATIAMPF